MMPMTPNPPIPSDSDPEYAKAVLALRSLPRVLYVGKSNSLRSRLPGYNFRPYPEIECRPKNVPARYVAALHRARALVHAQ